MKQDIDFTKEKIYKSNSRPGIGSYKCVICGLVINITNNNDILTVCPKCGSQSWIKLN